MNKRFLLGAILALGATSFSEESIVKLGDTVITTSESFGVEAREIPKNVTVITSEEIEQKGAQSVAEAIKGTPGIVVSYMDGSEPTFDLRGSGITSNSNTIVLLNGIPLNEIEGGYNTNQIPVAQIDRIEIIPLGGAVMYGDGATGGVINIISKQLKDEYNYGYVGVEAGSWETFRTDVSYGTKVGERFLIDLSFSGYRSDEFRDRNVGYEGERDKRDTLDLKAKYLLNDGFIEFRYNHYDMDDFYTGGVPKDVADNNPSAAGSSGGFIDEVTDLYQVTVSKKINSKLEFLSYGGYKEVENHSHSMPKNNSNQTFVKTQLKYNYVNDGYVIGGFDYRTGELDAISSYSGANNIEKESYAGYVLNRYRTGNIEFTQGYRRENIDYKDTLKTDYETEFKNDAIELGVNYYFSDVRSVYTSFTKAYRTPHSWDLSGLTVEDFKDFKAQDTLSYEIGYRDGIGNTGISASVFLTDTKDEIYYDKLSGSFGENKNFDGKTRRIGAELSLQHYFDRLTLRENISYIQPKVTSGVYDGNEFAGVSRWLANIGATYFLTDNWNINGEVYYRGASYANGDFTNSLEKVEDVITVDIISTYTFNSGIEIYGGIRNLFDEKYYDSVYLDEYYSNYWPGAERSFYAGFRYEF